MEQSEYQRQDSNSEGKRPTPDKSGSSSPPDAYQPTDSQVTVYLVDVHEMARILDVNEDWLYQRTRMNPPRIPCVRVGRNLRFEPQVILAFIREKGASLV